MVPKESALTNLPNEIQIPRNTDHRSLCRFSSREDGCYGELLGILRQVLKPESIIGRAKPQVELTAEETNCLHTLYISEYEDHKAAIEKPVGGTCLWILDNTIYRSWMLDPASTLLWISGGAGCGKSVMAAFLIDALRDNTKRGGLDFTICYHFFSDRNSSQRFGHFALCGILHQLISANQSLIKHVLDAYQKKGSQITRDLRTLWDILVEILSDPAVGNVVLVFDALEECAEESRQRLLDWIVELSLDQSLMDGHLKILLTSRPEFSIQTKLRGSWTKPLRLEDYMNHLESDIKTVVSTKIEVFDYSKGLTAFVFQQLVENADGTFLWISLILRLLEESGDSSHRGVIGVLKGSSRGHDLFNVYLEILNRIPTSRQKDARKVLQIAASAPRPLTLEEFNIAFVIDHSDPADGSCDLESRLQQDLPRFLLRLCGPFIRIVDGRVHLVHQTAKEFLLTAPPDGSKSPWTLQPAESNLFMARVCLWYLLDRSARPFSSNVNPNDWLEDADTDDGDSFVVYASTYWPIHFNEAQKCMDEKTVEDAVQLHKLASLGLSPWFNHYWSGIGFSGEPIPGLTPLITASISGHNAVVEFILQSNNASSQVSDSEGGNALLWASRCGHEGTTNLLLQSKLFDATASDNGGRTALWWATWGGHAKTASILLKAPGIDINSADKTGMSPLHVAAWLGHDSIVKMLLACPEIKTDIKDRTGWTALSWASWRGRSSIVRQFVLRDDISTMAASQDRYQRTPLARACEKGHTDVVRLLLRVSNPVVQDRVQRTPLSLAAQTGNATLMELLLSDSRISQQADKADEAGQTPFFWAASEGHEAIVGLMISRASATGQGCKNLINIDSPLYDEQTPLSIAAENGHLGVVRQLLQAGASPSSRDIENKTPLWWAASRNRADVVRFLLNQGVDPNVADKHGGRTPLLVAVEEAFPAVVQELIHAKNVRVDVRDWRGKTALWNAAHYGRADVVKALLNGITRFSVLGMRDAAAAAAAAKHPIVEEIIWAGIRSLYGPDERPEAGERRVSAPATSPTSYQGSQDVLPTLNDDIRGPGKWNIKGIGRRRTTTPGV